MVFLASGGRSRKAGKSAAVATDEEESEGERLTENENGDPPARTRPRRTTRNKLNEALTDDDNDDDNDDNDDDNVADPVTPKAKPRPRPVYQAKSGQKSPIKSVGSLERSPSVPASSIGGHDPPTPKSSRKRPRDQDDETGEQSDHRDARTVDDGQQSDTQATPAGDMNIRRKRVRH